jgi:hypothetical protein
MRLSGLLKKVSIKQQFLPQSGGNCCLIAAVGVDKACKRYSINCIYKSGDPQDIIILKHRICYTNDTFLIAQKGLIDVSEGILCKIISVPFLEGQILGLGNFISFGFYLLDNSVF